MRHRGLCVVALWTLPMMAMSSIQTNWHRASKHLPSGVYRVFMGNHMFIGESLDSYTNQVPARDSNLQSVEDVSIATLVSWDKAALFDIQYIDSWRFTMRLIVSDYKHDVAYPIEEPDEKLYLSSCPRTHRLIFGTTPTSFSVLRHGESSFLYTFQAPGGRFPYQVIEFDENYHLRWRSPTTISAPIGFRAVDTDWSMSSVNKRIYQDGLGLQRWLLKKELQQQQKNDKMFNKEWHQSFQHRVNQFPHLKHKLYRNPYASNTARNLPPPGNQKPPTASLRMASRPSLLKPIRS